MSNSFMGTASNTQLPVLLPTNPYKNHSPNPIHYQSTLNLSSGFFKRPYYNPLKLNLEAHFRNKSRKHKIQNLVIKSSKKCLLPRQNLSTSSLIPRNTSLHPHTTPVIEPPKHEFSRTVAYSNISPNKTYIEKVPQPLKIVTSYTVWKTLKNVNKEAKVYVVQGRYPDIRKALQGRGWYENSDKYSEFFDLKWMRSSKLPRFIKENQVVNHFDKIYELSTKVCLCKNLYKLQRKTDISVDTFFPKTFILNSNDSFDQFQNYYRRIVATNLLLNYLYNDNSLRTEKVFVAMQAVERWNRELARSTRFKITTCISSTEWRIIESANDLELKFLLPKNFQVDDSDLYSKVQNALSFLQENDDQFRINGDKNIWILKPGRKSRGRGIKLTNDYQKIVQYCNSAQQWVVQKYIEKPLLIQNRKFDIRQWVLVTNFKPITAYFYTDCYLRFCPESYDDSQLTNKMIHLTNNCVVKKSELFHDNSIEGCMWHIKQFKEHLCDTYNSDYWTEQIVPQIKEIIYYTLLSVSNKVVNRKNSFEFLGYDFMIDEMFHPWLLEVNTSPAMDYSTVTIIQKITEKLVQDALQDVIKVVLDLPNNSSASIGKFERIDISGYKGNRKN